MKLEIISRKPKGKAKPTQLLFVHGICVGAWVWDSYFMPYLAEAGFTCHAVSLRGHAGSEGHEGLAGWSLGDYTADLHEAARIIDAPVIAIGHSLGGAVVQDWLRTGGKAQGAALLASVPPWGLASSAWRMAFSSPRLFQEFAKLAALGVDSIDPALMRRALFSPDMPDDMYETFMKRVQDESRVISAELQGLRPFAPMPWQNPKMFVGGGAQDKLIPRDEVWGTATYYGVQPVIIDEMAHSVMIDTHWQKMADALLGWMNK